MARNWTWIDEDLERSDEEIDRVTPLLDQLARQWSQLHDAEEQRGEDDDERKERREAGLPPSWAEGEKARARALVCHRLLKEAMQLMGCAGAGAGKGD